MRYCNIDDENREHIKTLIKWLFEESLSAGGDGDAFWYSRYFDVKDIFPLVKEFNDGLNHSWKLELRNDAIWWSDQQESVFITNNEADWHNVPSYSQVIIRY